MEITRNLQRGAYDLHVHSAPEVFERPYDHYEVAEQARAVGMSGIVLKSHFSETASRAQLVRKCVPGIETYGSVVLNHYVGGLNPFAVYAAINMGAKIVFMPTIDAAHHMKCFGEESLTYGGFHTVSSGQHMDYKETKGITITQNGELLPVIDDIVNQVAEADIALATAHVSKTEIHALVDKAKSAGVKKIIITHAIWWALWVDEIDDLIEMGKKGAFVELVYPTIRTKDEPPEADKIPTVAHAIEVIKRIGAEHCIISSDCGQVINPPPVECLKGFYASFLKNGISKAQIETMIKVNPKFLLGLA